MTVLIVALIYTAGSIYYVYRFRGRMRYERFSQYLRKSWPVFAPFNCFLYAFTHAHARKSVTDTLHFPGTNLLRENWQIIRNEALALDKQGVFESIVKEGSPGFYDVGFRTFYKHGWSKFYLTWYGYNHPSAQRLCPQTTALLEKVPGIKGAMFSLLPAGASLTLHADPLACSLRYHLGLKTPQSDSCFINVDGVTTTWRDGEDFIFDETRPHYVHNHSEAPRLILMCDIERPMYLPGRLFNRLYNQLANLTVVANTEEDARGAASALFDRLNPVLKRGKRLKSTNKALYNTLKWAINGSLLMFIFGSLFTVSAAVDYLTFN
ncbi:Fe/alpha-ketoglutarate-dependent dioxygenase LpxO [Pseudomonas cannabina]|uniref:Fe/alpha-ketoglutarate-dependent dioxygenase LpxO n=2 Tax=Pseudomonas cannabina TaxID=86840 RepID=A0A3M3KYI4_PSECA|nr:aspartyl/asparaginyl beta-hydroxylase domain-containing protein [Pseudomonas cannabina]RMN28066.1 Fe/alpha-ketoglutarate-dependent dioxygenase LpxO [Pseudomonas cannabina]SDQ97510.1 beta-hydroxylase [Pseudomonas cannabina]